MVQCAECQKDNTLDSKFCRACGHALPEQALADAGAALEQLVAEGMKALSEGRLDEADLIADRTIADHPTHPQALSLKGDVLERQGDLAGALSMYERVVELSPSSALDRIKVEHVRRVLSASATPAAAPRQRAALGAAISTTVLLTVLGSLGAMLWNANQANAANRQSTTVASTGNGANATAGASTSLTNQPIPQAREVSREEFERLQREAQNEASARPSQPATSPATPTPRPEGIEARLPDARSNGGSNELSGQVRPMQVPLSLTPVDQPPSNPSAQPQPQPQPQPRQPSPDPDPEPSTTRPQRNPGTVDIRPSPGGPTRTGGSETIPDQPVNQSRDLLQRARQFFLTGDFAKAAEAYERALAAGADPGSTNQRLGQCYERLGRKAEAIRAYENAAKVFESRLQANPNNDAARSALEACRAAVANLRG